MSEIKKFNTQDNIQILWEVLLDEMKLEGINDNIISGIRTIFEKNIQMFCETERLTKSNLILLNKKFLGQIIIAIHQLYPQIKQYQNFKKIKIENEEVKIPYKAEDIQQERLQHFETEMYRRKMDFESLITPEKPPPMDFSDKVNDEKISEMDTLISQTIAQRNYEIDQIHNTNYMTHNLEDWLTSKETSVKIEKHQLNPTPLPNKSINHLKIRRLNYR